PVLTKMPLAICRSPAVQFEHHSPSDSSTWLEFTRLLFRFFGTTVLPVPASVPPLQFMVPDTVTVPEPVKVPLDKLKVVTLNEARSEERRVGKSVNVGGRRITITETSAVPARKLVVTVTMKP